jgi:hypothetical protein
MAANHRRAHRTNEALGATVMSFRFRAELRNASQVFDNHNFSWFL